MFVDDMFERVEGARDWLLLDLKGEPVPYGAANYKRIGRRRVDSIQIGRLLHARRRTVAMQTDPIVSWPPVFHGVQYNGVAGAMNKNRIEEQIPNGNCRINQD